MHKEKQDLDKALQKCFINPKVARVFALMIANKEMSYEKLTKLLNPFKNQTKRKEFESGKHNFEQYIIIENPSVQALLEKNLEDETCKDLIGSFLCQTGRNLDQLADRSDKKIINTGIEQKVLSLLFQLKATKIDNHVSRRVKSKTLYLKKLILDILSTYERCSNDVENSIVQYGGIQIALNNPIFKDKTFRCFFKNILDNCKTFNEIKKYGGIDIDLQRSKLVQSLSKCLISLKFSQQVSQNILTQLLENPLSHVVAINENLTNKQKSSFYCSEFYKSYTLKQYALILEYEECLHYKAKKDVSRILQFIEEQGMITTEIISLVTNFKVYELLKVKSLKRITKSLFRIIFDQCPDYLTSFKLIQYRKKSSESLKENQSINQKISLIDIYMKIRLPFEEWQIAQKGIMSRNYSIVDELSLNLKNKKQLIQYIFQIVQPYFHIQEKFIDFRSQTELALIQEIMKTGDFKFQQFEKFLSILSDILDDPSSFNKQQRHCQTSTNNNFIQKILDSQYFSCYKQNIRRDIKEESYFKGIDLMKSLYIKSFQQKTNGLYQNIDKYVKNMQKNEGQNVKHSKRIRKLHKSYNKDIQLIARFNQIRKNKN